MSKLRGKNYQIRQSNEFQEYLLDTLEIDYEKGSVKTKKVYCSIYVNIGFKSETVSIPLSQLVFFLKNKRWPKDEHHIDHKDDDPLNNHPDNLQEITKKDNWAKKKNKGNRRYGKNKYGHGINIYKDKRDGRYYADRYISTKIEDDLLTARRKIHLFGAATLDEIEIKIKEYVHRINNPIDLEDFIGL